MCDVLQSYIGVIINQISLFHYNYQGTYVADGFFALQGQICFLIAV